ncbi:hypothetical protein OSTOST_04112 [Ostertagia ostertagi]
MKCSLILPIALLITGVLSQRRRPPVVIRRIVHNHFNVRPFAPRFRPRPLPGRGVVGALVGLAAVSSVLSSRYAPYYPPPLPPYYGYYRQQMNSHALRHGEGAFCHRLGN